MRVLLVGWFSFWDGEATAGDVLSLQAVSWALEQARVPFDVAWGRGFTGEGVDVDEADPESYTHVVFVCGPVHGPQVAAVHERFARCRRYAVGVSVVDPADPTVTGFHRIWPRDAPTTAPQQDLAALAPSGEVPVTGVVLAHGQREYGERGRHTDVTETIIGWLAGKDCARVPLDTRLDAEDWRLARTPAQLESVVRRLDLVVTTRLHGLVLALKNGVPALAVDPVQGGAKVSAQARAWRWPAVLEAGAVDTAALDRSFDWCRSASGRLWAARSRGPGTAASALTDLVSAINADVAAGRR